MGLCLPLKHLNQIGMPLFANAKRKKKNGKFILTEHVIKRNMDAVIAVFNRKMQNDVRNKRLEERISNRRKRSKKASKFSFNGF